MQYRSEVYDESSVQLVYSPQSFQSAQAPVEIVHLSNHQPPARRKREGKSSAYRKDLGRKSQQHDVRTNSSLETVEEEKRDPLNLVRTSDGEWEKKD